MQHLEEIITSTRQKTVIIGRISKNRCCQSENLKSEIRICSLQQLQNQ